jgi:mono/diheme cytochrome c family protein
MFKHSRAPFFIVLALFTFLVVAATDVSAQDGAAVFTAKCAMCHGKDATGNTPMGMKLKARDLHSPEVQKQTDAEIRTIIAKGKAKMPAYEAKLAKEQIDSLVAYVRGLSKK